MYYIFDLDGKTIRPAIKGSEPVSVDIAFEGVVSTNWSAISFSKLSRLAYAGFKPGESEGVSFSDRLAELAASVPELNNSLPPQFAQSVLLLEGFGFLWDEVVFDICSEREFRNGLSEVSRSISAMGSADVISHLNRHPKRTLFTNGAGEEYGFSDVTGSVSPRSGKLVLARKILSALLNDAAFVSIAGSKMVCGSAEPLASEIKRSLAVIDSAYEHLFRISLDDSRVLSKTLSACSAEILGLREPYAEKLATGLELGLTGEDLSLVISVLADSFGPSCSDPILFDADDGYVPYEDEMNFILRPHAWGEGDSSLTSLLTDVIDDRRFDAIAAPLLSVFESAPVIYQVESLLGLLGLLLHLNMVVLGRKLSKCEVCNRLFIRRSPNNKSCSYLVPPELRDPGRPSLSCAEYSARRNGDRATDEAKSRRKMNNNLTRKIKKARNAAESLTAQPEEKEYYAYLLLVRSYMRTLSHKYECHCASAELRSWWDAHASLNKKDVQDLLNEADDLRGGKLASPPTLFWELGSQGLTPVEIDWSRYHRDLVTIEHGTELLKLLPSRLTEDSKRAFEMEYGLARDLKISAQDA